jgi:hypothetical protein
MEERREIYHCHDVSDSAEWTVEDEHGPQLFRRGEGESPQEMEAGVSKRLWTPLPMRCGWRRRVRDVGADRCVPSNLRAQEHPIMELRRS